MEERTTTMEKTTTKKRARRSRCNCCGQQITEKQVIKANDAQSYIDNYGASDDELVWIGKDGNAMCYGSHFDTYHYTQREQDEANA
jgi:hypothetical protein